MQVEVLLQMRELVQDTCSKGQVLLLRWIDAVRDGISVIHTVSHIIVTTSKFHYTVKQVLQNLKHTL